MVKIERNDHCVIVYCESAKRGIVFPTTIDKDVDLFLRELQERTQFIEKGTILVILLFDKKYEDNYRPIQLFLENHNVEDVLHDDSTAIELYKFYFENAIIRVSPAGAAWIFCK